MKMNKRTTDSYYINKYTYWTYKGRIYPFVHFWKRSLNIHKLKNNWKVFKKRKLPKLNEFPDINDVYIFTMIYIHLDECRAGA